jgi:hypothetical protein
LKGNGDRKFRGHFGKASLQELSQNSSKNEFKSIKKQAMTHATALVSVMMKLSESEPDCSFH